MPIHIDKTTRQRIVFSKHTGDIQFDLSGDDSISREDVPLIGEWSDWTGNGGVNSHTQQNWAGIENQLQGTDAQIDGKAKLNQLSVIGTRLNTHRRRIIRRHIDGAELNAEHSEFSSNI